MCIYLTWEIRKYFEIKVYLNKLRYCDCGSEDSIIRFLFALNWLLGSI